MSGRFSNITIISFLTICIWSTCIQHVDASPINVTNKNVTAMASDSFGIVWVTTHQFLGRFDGEAYFPVDEAENSILFEGSNVVNTMVCDSRDMLYLFTDNGIFSYDIIHKVMTHLSPLKGIKIRSVVHNKKMTTFFLNTYNGIYSFTPEVSDARLILNYPDEESGEEARNSDYIGIDRSENIWTVSGCRLLKLRLDAGSAGGRYQIDSLLRFKYNYNIFFDANDFMYAYNKDNFLFGRYNSNGGKNKFNVEFDEITAATLYGDNVALGIRGKGCRTIFRNRAGEELWRTDKSVSTESDHFSNNISTLMSDASGNMWAGTFNGVVRINPSVSESTFLSCSSNDSTYRLSSNSIRDLIEHNGTIWAATAEGLDRISFDPRGRISEVKTFKVPENVSSGIRRNKLRQLEMDPQERIWVGTEETVVIFESQKERFISCDAVARSAQADKRVSGMAADLDGNVWIGYDNGLFRYDPATDSISEIQGLDELEKDCKTVRVDGRNETWVLSSSKNVIHISPTGESSIISFPDQHMKDATLRTTDLYVDPMNNIWVGTNKGLFAYSDVNESLSEVTLPLERTSAYICGISSDRSGNLWLTTPEGICSYDVKEQRAQFIPMHNGQFCENNFQPSVWSDRPGMVMSCMNGITYFNPNRIVNNKTSSRCVFTTFSYGNHPSDLDINYLDGIRLKHRDNAISFSYSSTTYDTPGTIQYSHRLSGIDEDWVMDGNTPSLITYPRIKAGHHKLDIRCTNAFGVWQEAKTLDVTVKTPKSLSWWAILCYLCLMGACVGGILIVFRKKALKFTREAVRKSRVHQLQEITNSLKNPLTILQSSLGELMSGGKAYDAEKNQYLVETINAGSKRLALLVDQMEQLIQLSDGENALAKKNMDIVKFFYEVCEAFRPLLVSKKIKLSCTSDVESAIVSFNSEKMESIFFGILSYLFKYTLSKGTVTAECNEKDGRVCLRFTGTESVANKNDLIGLFEHTREDNDLGLSMVLAGENIRLHGGEVSTSIRGKTLIIDLSFPIAAIPDMQDEASATSAELTRHIDAIEVKESAYEGPSNADISTYVISGDESFCRYLEGRLGRMLKIRCFKNIDQANDAIRKAKPDAVVCDVRFEGSRKGLELCRQLKASAQTSDIRFIVISTTKDAEAQKESYDSGADTFIPKPFDVEFLRIRIGQLVQSRKELQSSVRKEMIMTPKTINAQSDSERFLAAAMKVIEKNMDNEDFCADDFASEMNMSPSMLYRKIKAIGDSSPASFVRTIRLKRAAQLLTTDAYNISEIASMVGFPDIHYFSTCFKKEFGMTPSSYKKENSRE